MIQELTPNRKSKSLYQQQLQKSSLGNHKISLELNFTKICDIITLVVGNLKEADYN
jgi:hypothetical protein